MYRTHIAARRRNPRQHNASFQTIPCIRLEEYQHPSSMDSSIMEFYSMCFIFDLPNEILHKIVAILLRNQGRWRRTLHETWEQVQTLMSVSKRFRAIALEAQFWTSEDFTFDALFPVTWEDRTARSLKGARRWLAEISRVKALISDDRILERLARKTRWEFWSTETLELAVLVIPHFLSTVREITLAMPEMVSFGHLSLCSHITTLIVSEPHEKIDLGQIHQVFPFLEELGLYEGGEYDGNLSNISTLRTLAVYAQSCNLKLAPFIPLRSTSTLTHLELVNFTDWIRPEETTALSPFTNLTYLELTCLKGEDCDLVAELSSKLSTFIYNSSEFDMIPLPKLERMFHSDSLSCLTTLMIQLTYFPEGPDPARQTYQQNCYSILQIITVALPYLEEFGAEAYIEEDWSQMFKKWRNLKRLQLTLEGDYEPKSWIKFENGVRKVFDGLEEKLTITFGDLEWAQFRER